MDKYLDDKLVAAINWVIIGGVMVLLSGESTYIQRLAIGYLLILSGGVLGLLCGVAKYIGKKKEEIPKLSKESLKTMSELAR